MKNFLVITLLLMMSFPSAEAEMTAVDFDDGSLQGKRLFVAFTAPWCGHCKQLKPAWETVRDEVKDVDFLRIGTIDCTDDGNKALCDRNAIQGFPTIKYGHLDNLENYEGGRDVEALRSFALDLKPVCAIGFEVHCSDEEQTLLASLIDMDAATLENSIKEHDVKVQGIEKRYTDDVAKLQNEYANITAVKKDAIQTLNTDANIGFIKGVLNHKRKSTADKSDL